MPATQPARPISVSHHAALALRDRTKDTRPVRMLIDKIEEWVRCGLEAGNVLNYKPEGFVLFGSHRDALPPGQRFVWCGEEPRFGFVIKRDPAGPDVVLTTITRVGVRRR
jgi:hypothetical protein